MVCVHRIAIHAVDAVREHHGDALHPAAVACLELHAHGRHGSVAAVGERPVESNTFPALCAYACPAAAASEIVILDVVQRKGGFAVGICPYAATHVLLHVLGCAETRNAIPVRVPRGRNVAIARGAVARLGRFIDDYAVRVNPREV